ncbi:7 transmembrane sweet-taste receptor of 3 GCPR [Phytophthora infestans]|uniref:7 transmembrane sweet-taste receptor of 3 GCPR n=1 Tax=Phytophthora infestans TaxID=4787 RepID=A0A833WBD3_PHYIN|nr:7 transmembrane sweet-taste receptor of 3 GCPR [Phytophthora infestans]
MPTSSPTFKALAALAAIVAVLLVAAAGVVVKHRNAPIIRRSQYEMLLLMIFGGFFTTGAAVAYAGRPTGTLCGIRPVLVCIGFTTIFGALVMKSLRVYRGVFMKSAMKRVKVTLLTILKFLAIFYVGDIIIFIAWYGADFPAPTITTEEASEFRGTVDKISCSSSSFIFTALLIFWKTILLVLGLYLSFLIRYVSVDFQESPWIFGSVVVVLVGCVLVMPMSYLVTMRAATYYVFLACTLLICTMVIMGLMLVPRNFRLKEVGTVTRKASSVCEVDTASFQPSQDLY